MYYYAYINSDSIVTGVYQFPTEVSMAGYIAITQEQYTNGNLVGKFYNAETGEFVSLPDWIGSTDEVKYKQTAVVLSAKLDAMDEAIASAQAGADGASAYEIAVANGFEGSEEQWLASLVGATGATGEQGVQGEKGDKGDKGETGAAGASGQNGTTVIVGTTTTGNAGTNANVTGTLNSETNTLTLDFTIPKGANGESGTSASITADEVLTKIKTVDGANSGLDADTLDGVHANGFATADHTHSNYATVSALETLSETVDGKANAVHTHSGYASTSDIETLQTAINGKANANHTHTEYAAANHTHSDYASVDDVEAIETALSGKADTSHTHGVATTSAKGFLSSADKSKLDGIATGANKTVVDTAMSSTSTNPVQNKTVNSALDNKVDKVTGKGLSTNDYTTDEKTKLAGIATGANKYTHPSYTAKSSGLYKVAVDSTGHISGTTAVAKADITALGIPSTNTTYVNATTSTAGLMSTTDKSKLDGIATGANKTTVDTALSSTSTNPVQNKVINTALAGKASTSHNHNSAYIAKSLQMTADDGDVYVTWSNQDVVAKIKALPTGMYTAYAKAGTTNNPKTTEGWRFLVHKTTNAVGWVQAFGSSGSMFLGTVDSDGWKGWKCIFDADPTPLWTGKLYMAGTDSTPQTVTPSKKLSECRNGWLLLWSDYDPDTSTANDADFATTIIPKSNATGGNWNGKSFLCDIPRYIGSNVNDVDTERRIMKTLYIYDNYIKGSPNNNKDDRNDVVLRAVYEW